MKPALVAVLCSSPVGCLSPPDYSSCTPGELVAIGLSAAALIASFIMSLWAVKPGGRKAISVLAAATSVLAGVSLVLVALVGLAGIFFEQWLKSVTSR